MPYISSYEEIRILVVMGFHPHVTKILINGMKHPIYGILIMVKYYFIIYGIIPRRYRLVQCLQ